MPSSYNQNSLKKSKKIASRSLTKKHGQQDMLLSDMLELMRQINQNNESTNKEFLSPQRRSDGHYVTSKATLEMKNLVLRIFSNLEQDKYQQ